jgi:hypothetical protein
LWAALLLLSIRHKRPFSFGCVGETTTLCRSWTDYYWVNDGRGARRTSGLLQVLVKKRERRSGRILTQWPPLLSAHRLLCKKKSSFQYSRARLSRCAQPRNTTSVNFTAAIPRHLCQHNKHGSY